MIESPTKPVTWIIDGIWGLHSRWEGLRRLIQGEVGPCKIWRYNNSGRVNLENLGTCLCRDLVTELRGRPFHLVGYSMGGLIAREAMRQSPGLPLQRTTFLHSPHSGSLAALLLPLPATRDMIPSSRFLQRLGTVPWQFPTLVTWCPWDLMVLPGRSAAWDKATEIVRVDTPAHAWPVFSPRVHKMVANFLGQI